ncbi:hypothetical protein FACS189468_0020 [Spirochaetia bacterium]|nr:hypothetical protein FACS189468_0020 [Spirochaetia bacterium]
MTVSQKAALSLLLSVLIIAGLSVLAFTGLFDLVETRFYNPAITRSVQRDLDRNTGIIQDFLAALEERFAAALEEPAVQRSFLPNRSAEDVLERTRFYEAFLASQGGLQSVRFIDSGGLRLHFSTSGDDVLRRYRSSTAYRNYNETPGYIPYEEVAARKNPRLVLDQRGERIIFALPFFDSLEEYRGTALFSLSVRAVTERLINEGSLKAGEPLFVVASPPGMVSGLPAGRGRNTLIPLVASIWHDGILTLTTLNPETSGTALALISAKTSQGIYTGRIVAESLFSFPLTLKLVLLGCIFFTVYLSMFLFFNFRPDPMTVIRNRLGELQLSLIGEYYGRKGEMDWDRWRRELEQRREEVRRELKRGIKIKAGHQTEDIDFLIDKSWDELLNTIGGKRESSVTAVIDEEKLQAGLSRALQAAGIIPALAPFTGKKPYEEELEELRGPEDDLEELEGAKAPADETPPEEALDLAGWIEFASAEDEEPGDHWPPDFETASPFAAVLSELDDETLRALEAAGYGSAIGTGEAAKQTVGTPEEKEITREQDGITYVNVETLNTDEETEQRLDPGLKSLVNSILNKN